MRLFLAFHVIMVSMTGTLRAQQLTCGSHAVDSILDIGTLSDTARLNRARDVVWTDFLFSEPDVAYDLAQCLAMMAQAGKHALQEADALNIQAISLGLRGNNAKAMELHTRCLQLREQAKDRAAIASSLNNMGNLYLAMNDGQKALEKHHGSRAIRAALADSAGLSASFNNLGNAHLKLSQLDSAQYWYGLSLKAKLKLGDRKGTVSSLLNIGKVLIELEVYDTAMARFTEALSLAEEIGSAQLMASALNNIGLTNGRTGNHSKAMEAAERAMILAKEAELLTAQRDAADVIQESAAALGQFSMAYAMHVLYTQLRDSIVSEENQREVMRHQFQYDFDKKEAVLKAEQEARDAIAAEKLRQRELQRNGLILFVLLALIAAMVLYLSYRAKKRLAAQLEQANQKLTVSEAELKEANAAKDRIFAILSHDLRSPIAQLSSLVDLFRFDPDMDRTALDRMLGQAQVSLGHVLGMAENLLQWARLQMDRISARPEQVDLEVLVAEVQAQLGALAQKKEVSFRTDLAARHVCSDRAILSIALRNVMANAVRFSPQGGQVRISAEIAGADLCIRVFDSGPGFAEPTNGGSGLSAKGGEGAGIGLHVSRQLIALLNGRIENSRQGSETVVSIIIPLAAA